MSKDSTEEEDASAQQDELPSGEDVHIEETELPEAEEDTGPTSTPERRNRYINQSPGLSTQDIQVCEKQ